MKKIAVGLPIKMKMSMKKIHEIGLLQYLPMWQNVERQTINRLIFVKLKLTNKTCRKRHIYSSVMLLSLFN